jgi:hypothetical protein
MGWIMETLGNPSGEPWVSMGSTIHF